MSVTNIGTLVAGSKWDEIVSRINSYFAINADAKRLVSKSKEAMRWAEKSNVEFGRGWPDQTWFMFFKNRLAELGELRGIAGKPPVSGGRVGVLHVFPLDMYETPEMLRRLHNEKPDQSQVARSKISKSLSAEINPVNVVAGRVMVGEIQ